MTNWISVTDKLPPPLTDVLAIVQYNADTWNYKIAYIMRDRWRIINDYTMNGVVTWWMPIPPKPQTDKEAYK